MTVIERVGDIWESDADWICIPTNGQRRASGDAIMGAGLAKQALLKCHGVDRVLGQSLTKDGNHVKCLGTWTVEGVSRRLIAFPTKNAWKDRSDLDLIRRSAQELYGLLLGDDQIVLPRVGTGCGGLGWSVVRDVLTEELPGARFIVVSQ
jgi:hypothetical protein